MRGACVVRFRSFVMGVSPPSIACCASVCVAVAHCVWDQLSAGCIESGLYSAARNKLELVSYSGLLD